MHFSWWVQDVIAEASVADASREDAPARVVFGFDGDPATRILAIRGLWEHEGEEVMGLLTELNKAGTTIIIVTHSMRDAGYAQRTIKLLDGKVVEGNVPVQTLL